MAKQSIFVGEVYNSNKCGPYRITAYIDTKNVHIEFVNTGTKAVVEGREIKRGRIKDPMCPSVLGVGYLGIGGFPTSVFCEKKGKYVKHPVYVLWTSMMTRCYSRATHLRQPCYIGCDVAPEWRCYQYFFLSVRKLVGFEKWCNYQLGLSDICMELDKDKLVSGNKTYGPTTCCFISSAENVMIAAIAKFNKEGGQ